MDACSIQDVDACLIFLTIWRFRCLIYPGMFDEPAFDFKHSICSYARSPSLDETVLRIGCDFEIVTLNPIRKFMLFQFGTENFLATDIAEGFCSVVNCDYLTSA